MELFGLADCNNFFCSCERVFHPDLNGKPVVVLSNNDGCIIARSNEAKALGLKMGQPFYQIKDQLEQQGVAVFSSNYNLYGDMSHRVMSLLSQYTPHLDIYSIDEAFLDFNGMGTTEQLGEYARDMVRTISKGTGIPISVGIAPTKTLAKMASKFAKQYPRYNGVAIIDTDQKRQKALELFPVGDVWGIGRQFLKRLEYYGIGTAAEFAAKKASWVQREFNLPGLRTWKELNGQSCIETESMPQKQSICTSRSFPDSGLKELGPVEEAIANFAASCARKLREQHTVCGAITVFAHTSRFRTDIPQNCIYQNIYLNVHTANQQEIVSCACNALRSSWDTSNRFLYKKAGVIVWNITPNSSIQGDLFDTVDRQRMQALMNAVDAVNHKNGHNTVRMAAQGFSKQWHLKTEHISRQYTTNLDQIISIKA